MCGPMLMDYMPSSRRCSNGPDKAVTGCARRSFLHSKLAQPDARHTCRCMRALISCRPTCAWIRYRVAREICCRVRNQMSAHDGASNQPGDTEGTSCKPARSSEASFEHDSHCWCGATLDCTCSAAS